MYLILSSIVLSGIIFSVFVWYGERGNKFRHNFASVAGVLGMALTGIAFVVYGITIWNWLAADHKAQIINREYGTNYTQAEVFYASDVIDTVRQLDRKRYEINGDFVRGKEAKP